MSETVDILEFDFSSAINGEKFKEFFGLMALAGVSYTTGREGNDEYNETLNGVQTSNALDHNIDVQSVDYDESRQALMRAGQILEWRKK